MNTLRRSRTGLWSGLLLLLISFFPGPGFGALSEKGQAEPLVLVILPVENISSMYARFLPIREHLESALKQPVVLKVASDYQETIQIIGTGGAQLAYLDPSAFCEAHHDYGVVPLVKTVVQGSATYRSVLVSRSDSPLERIVDTRGSRLALGNRSSSSSYLIPTAMLKEVGIELTDFAAVDYLEEEDRIALSVLTRRYDVGGLSEEVALKYLDSGLKVVALSEAIPQYTIAASASVPESLRTRIREALLGLKLAGSDRKGRKRADIEGFAPAEDRDYDVVRVMINDLSEINYMEYGPRTMKVAILPLYSAITLFERFDPLMRHLSARGPYEFKLFIPRDFEHFYETVSQGRVEFSYSNPYIYIQLADKGFLRAFANTIKPPTGDVFRGIVITRASSPIQTLEGLKGKRVMIVSPLSAGGYLAQKLFLLENGIDIDRDLTIIDGKRQEEVILNVYRGNVDAGFVRETAPDVLREEIDLRQIKILATTPYIANWPFAATRKADARVTELLRDELSRLNDPEVLRAARVAGFQKADDHDFDSLRNWIRKHASR